MKDWVSEAGLAVVEVIGTGERSLWAAEVAEGVEDSRNWSNRMGKTMLARLFSKDIRAHEADGRQYLYRTAVPRDRYVAGESRRLVDRLFGGRTAPVVVRLVRGDGLTKNDIAERQALLLQLRA